ncbi:hypothetical protein TCAL_03215 [Tigriopus californicus]|uniref:Fe2OG dioxygenase domain-containing protein n=2 Tax=Tigriopus californicus TaxID=6832 RepID=A0A553NTV0_TIGCA|nr:hypothetical protein TCAL_03215 [Tigriopus californicus]
MCSFYKYYSGEKVAPILTLFIGGNHEASNVLQELPYGGWVAPNIYYLGYAGVLNVGGVRIGGLSGIYNGHNYLKGHFERPPYDRSTQRSAYHVRNLEAFRLKQLAPDPPQILMSHDWPEDADKFGNLEQLLRFKPHFRDDVQAHKLGSRPAREILDIVQPEYWFSGHLHCKYAAVIEHDGGQSTKFLALDKCLPRRRFLQILSVGSDIEHEEVPLEYDPAWLAILKSTNHLLSVTNRTQHMPGPGYNDRYDFQPTAEEIQAVERLFEGDFRVPKNFQKSAPAFDPEHESLRDLRHTGQSEFELNPQTVAFTEKLQIANPVAMLMMAQVNLQDHVIKGIPELGFYIPEFITIQREKYLLHEISKISKVKWQQLSNRRLLNFGTQSDPAKALLSPTPIPKWLTDHIDDIMNLKAFTPENRPNNVLLNEYLPGQGIMPHFDGDSYHPVITTISLGSHTVLNFYRDFDEDQSDNSLQGRRKFSLMVEPRSLLVLTQDLYSKYLHGIDEVTEDHLDHVSNPKPNLQLGVQERGTRGVSKMHIAIDGCAHGALEETYAAIAECQAQTGQKIDLLLCCGDFQSVRNLRDLLCMARPDKYKDMCSFYKYYSGEKVAPILTLFIGGNHEASNVLQELPYGGWVAPNIYYLGYAGVLNVGGVRIGGLSGIFKPDNYLRGHFERPPYNMSTLRSAYHIRNLEVFRMKQLAPDPPQIVMSHDWPEGVDKFGNLEGLLDLKPHFRDQSDEHRLGSPPTREVLDIVQPEYWFSAHLHCKYAAVIEHDGGRNTKFLSLDKCSSGSPFLQILTVGAEIESGEVSLEYDPAWLAILKSTNHLLSVNRRTHYMPGPDSDERYDFQPTSQEIQEVERLFEGDFRVPRNFQKSVPAFDPKRESIQDLYHLKQSQFELNLDTVAFTEKLQIANPVTMLMSESEVRKQLEVPKEYTPLQLVSTRLLSRTMVPTTDDV